MNKKIGSIEADYLIYLNRSNFLFIHRIYVTAKYIHTAWNLSMMMMIIVYIKILLY